MEKMNNLRDLLKHELEDLRSAEDQITAALPKMIENARNPQLKQSLQEHLRVTEQQLRRLDRIDEMVKRNNEGEGESKGFLAGLFGGGGHKCRGMEGIIVEGEKIMKEDMDPDVKDAAIIASCQKVEHYEICGYGTARAFARELQLTEVERLLTETLMEEYQADELLTTLAVIGGLNEEAMSRRGGSNGGSRGGGRSSSRSSSGGRSSGGSKGSGRGGSSRSAGKRASKSSGRSASKSSGRSASKSAGGRTASKSSGGRSKSASKSSSRGASKGSSRSSKGASKSSGRGGSKSARGAKKGGRKTASKSRR